MVKNPVSSLKVRPGRTWLKPSITQDLHLGGSETGLMGESTWFPPGDSVKKLLVKRSLNPVSRSRSGSRREIINYQLSMPNYQFPIIFVDRPICGKLLSNQLDGEPKQPKRDKINPQLPQQSPLCRHLCKPLQLPPTLRQFS